MVTKCRALARFKRRQPRTAHEPCPDCISIIVPEGDWCMYICHWLYNIIIIMNNMS